MEPTALFKAYADVRAHMLTTRILVVGFVWIFWGWMIALLTCAVWIFAWRMLANSLYQDMIEQFRIRIVIMDPDSPEAEEIRQAHEEE